MRASMHCPRGTAHVQSRSNRHLRKIPGISPALLFAVLALCILQSCLSDSSWNYADIQSKGEAVLRATGAAAPSSAWRQPESTAIRAAAAKGKQAANNSSRVGQGVCGDEMFAHWASTFNYTFPPAARTAAQQRFCQNMEQVKRINSNASIPFWASGNAFSHFSFQEFSARYLTNLTADEPSQPRAQLKPAPPPKLRKMLDATAPPPFKTYVNWVQAGKVTPIRQQGASCNACWAFAAVSVIESMYLISSNDSGVSAADPAMHLSEQQLVSCVGAAAGFQSRGCSSGRSDEAIDYAADNALVLNSLYPYSASAPACNPNLTSAAAAAPGQSVRLSGYHQRVPANDESSMVQAVQAAPTVAYFSVDSTFVLYAGGLYTPLESNTNKVNHAVVLVGFNATVSSNRFWLVRNHWGGFWGEKGYARVKMTGSAAGGVGPCGMYQFGFLPPSTFASAPLQLPPTVQSASKKPSPTAAKQAQ